MNKSKWLTHIYFFDKVAMKESIINVHLTKRPPLRKCNCKHNFDGLRLDDWIERFKVINAKSLVIVLNHYSCFIVGNGAI